MVTDKVVHAKIDRPAGIVNFEKKRNVEEVLNDWSTDLGKMLGLVEKTGHLINKASVSFSCSRCREILADLYISVATCYRNTLSMLLELRLDRTSWDELVFCLTILHDVHSATRNSRLIPHVLGVLTWRYRSLTLLSRMSGSLHGQGPPTSLRRPSALPIITDW